MQLMQSVYYKLDLQNIYQQKFYISALQTELARKGQENQEEQKRLRETVEALQKQLHQNEVNLRSKENELRIEQDRLAEERRKLETEKEITLATLRHDQTRLQVNNTIVSLFKRSIAKSRFTGYLLAIIMT